MSEPIDRRAFMHRAAGAGAAVSISLAGPLTRQVQGANDRVRVGVIGSGRQGRSNLEAFKKNGAEIAAVCDVFAPNLAKGKEAGRGRAATAYTDFRRLLDDKTIDLVVEHPPTTGTPCPRSWRARPARTSSSRSRSRSRSRKARRCSPPPASTSASSRSGSGSARTPTSSRRPRSSARGSSAGSPSSAPGTTETPPGRHRQPPDSEPPAGLDWDMWLGPAPKVPFNANRFGVGDHWSTFRHFWDYSNGMLGDWAVHLVDIVQWALDTPGPQAVTGVGQKFAVKDNADTPDTLQATFEYPGFVCTYENRQANGNSMFGKGYGIEFHGTEATMFLNRSGFEVFPETRTVWEETPPGEEPEGGHPLGLDEDGRGGRRARKPRGQHARSTWDTGSVQASDIEDGLHSSATCLLGVVALRTRERIEFDPVKLSSGTAARLRGSSSAASTARPGS